MTRLLSFCLISCVVFLLKLGGGLQLRSRKTLGKLIGSVIYRIAPGRRLIVERNLDLCFGPDDSCERNTLVRNCFDEFGIGLLEMGRAWGTPKSRLLAELTLYGEEPLVAAKASGKGVLVLCPHYTSLELSPSFIEAAVGRLVISYRPHELIDLERVLRVGRSRYAELVNVRSIRNLLRVLNEGNVLWFGPDQDMGRKGSVFAPFFGHPAATVTTPAWLAKKTGCAVFFFALSRRDTGYHGSFIEMPPGYPYEDEVENAAILNRMIEQSLADDPAQYMWMHKRFKTQPDLPRYSLYK